MAETVKCKAIILKEVLYNETDKMLTAISDEYGLMTISAKGAKKTNSKFLAVTQQFCYSEMELSLSKNGIYNLIEAELLSSFYDLRCDYDILLVANEIGEIALKVAQVELPNVDLLRLLLNTLYILDKKLLKTDLVVSIFKIRLCYNEGMMPEPKVKLNGTLLAISHIIESDYKHLFAFSVNDDVLKELVSFGNKSLNGIKNAL